MTYRELAAKTGWSLAVIGEYFTGRTLPATDRFDTLIRLLGATANELAPLATARDRVEDGQRGSGNRAAAGAVRLGGPTMVGRRIELARLSAEVHAAVGGRGGAMFLLGEAGIGKSRLAAEAARVAEAAGLRVLRGRAGTPAAPFRPLVEALLSVMRRAPPPDDPRLAAYRPTLSRLVPEWGPERPGATESLVVLAEGLLRLVVALGEPHGSVLILEDLHESDMDTMAVLDYLIDHAADERLLVIGTARAEPGAVLDAIRAAQRRRVAGAIELTRLGDDGVRELAAGCLEVQPEQVPEPVVARLVSAADGVPLHVEELLADLVSDRVLVRPKDRWTVRSGRSSRECRPRSPQHSSAGWAGSGRAPERCCAWPR